VAENGSVADVTSTPRREVSRKRAGFRRALEVATNYLYLLPTIIGLLVFSAGAVIMSFGLSLSNWEGQTWLRNVPWVGLKNYAKAFTDPLFPKVIWNTAYYVLGSVPLNMIIGLFLAALVNQKFPGVTVFRALYFLPVVTSGVAVALIFTWLFAPMFGPVNEILWNLFHIKGPNWLATTEWAMPTLIITGVWKGVGYTMVLFLAGLQGVDEVLYEAARIDGANRLQSFLRITLPLLTPTTFFIMITSIIGSFQTFVPTYVMTQGGPYYSTTTLPYWIYSNAFVWFHMSYAAALAYVLFAMILAFTLLQWKLQQKWVFYT